MREPSTTAKSLREKIKCAGPPDSFISVVRRKFSTPNITAELGILEVRAGNTFAGHSFSLRNELFSLLGRELNDHISFVTKFGKTPHLSDHLASYLIAEMQQLRAEIVDIKGREVATERFALAISSALASLYFSGLVDHAFILLAPIFVFIFGLLRAKEFQRNVFEIDAYIRQIEYLFTPSGGWVNYFFRFRKMEEYFHTRIWFWLLLIFFYALLVIFFGKFNDPTINVRLLFSPPK